MRAKNKFLIPKTDFNALVEDAKKSHAPKEDAHIKIWFSLADRILADWDGVSYSILLDALTPGQYAVVCAAELHRDTKGQDFITFVTCKPGLAHLTFKALEVLKADEYLKLLRQVEAVFPDKQFPEYAEDIMYAIMKLPSNYFNNIGTKFLTGKGMKRPLHEYVFAYILAHPEDFCEA